MGVASIREICLDILRWSECCLIHLMQIMDKNTQLSFATVNPKCAEVFWKYSSSFYIHILEADSEERDFF